VEYAQNYAYPLPLGLDPWPNESSALEGGRRQPIERVLQTLATAFKIYRLLGITQCVEKKPELLHFLGSLNLCLHLQEVVPSRCSASRVQDDHGGEAGLQLVELGPERDEKGNESFVIHAPEVYH